MTMLSQVITENVKNEQRQETLPTPTNGIEARVGYTIASCESSAEGSKLVLTKHVPEQIMVRYVRAAMRRVESRQLEDGQSFVEIPGLDGIWASNMDAESAFDELEEVLIDWLLLKIEHEDRDIPILDSISLNNIR